MPDEILLTTDEAMKKLNVSRGTFFNRIKELNIKPSNYNPALKKQHKPLYKASDIKRMGNAHEDDSDVPQNAA